MKPFGGAIVPQGALIRVRLHRGPGHAPIEGPALIDTGAPVNLVAAACVPQGAAPIYSTVVQGIGAGQPTTLIGYDMLLEFLDAQPPLAMVLRAPSGQLVPSNFLYASSDIVPPLVALIGRQMLSNFTMTWDGPGGVCMLVPCPSRNLAAP